MNKNGTVSREVVRRIIDSPRTKEQMLSMLEATPTVEEKHLTIQEQIEKVQEQMCDEYCKWPQAPVPEGRSEDWLFDEDGPCQTCPMNRL